MNFHCKKALLKKYGFVFLRKARHGSIFEDSSGNRVMLARRSGRDVRADRNFIADIMRINRERHQFKKSNHN